MNLFYLQPGKKLHKRISHYKKPSRLCIFCDTMQFGGKLSRHIKVCHKNEARVENALKMGRKNMLAQFNFLKRMVFTSTTLNRLPKRNLPIKERKQQMFGPRLFVVDRVSHLSEPEGLTDIKTIVNKMIVRR